ncbi:SDR family oxidoreductase [Rhodohalobacter mucosus]|uniref:NAD-dependent dehydratase n=1 Tax=Rhodohalobacter mucosus TaxID=2079485 RepID=A0A316TMQ7_9BACT|nr:SDR family oxidoreductase [Rhodohalobacter mucosus]PWN05893.1 NAD-dependent dehydratase [Rhodohalobacter mucosus]
MEIAIAGAHGQVAMHVHPILSKRGHRVRGIIRDPKQADDLKKAGAEPVIADLEEDGADQLSEAIDTADAVVFAAGAGPGSGKERKWTVDRDGAVKLMEAAKKSGVNHFIIISAMGLDTPRGSEVFQVYQKAKAEADEALRKSGLDYTIIKPGRLTNDPGTGKIKAGNLKRGEIPREDVARVIAYVLDHPDLTKGLEFDVLSGEKPVDEAIAELKEQ